MKHNEIELEDWKDFAKNFPLYGQLRNKAIGITELRACWAPAWFIAWKNSTDSTD